jgi:hypothetical protein
VFVTLTAPSFGPVHFRRMRGKTVLLFTGPTGVPLWHSSFRHRYWLPALAKAGLTGIHLHDLRHTSNHLAATSE